MQSTLKIYEKKLHEIWLTQNYASPLKTVSGEEVIILYAGEPNDDTAGPDFKNARIRIGNLVYVGDIEIDCDYNNWKGHGHNIDNKHNKVILHASLINKHNQHYVYTKDGRRIPTVCLARFVDRASLTEIEGFISNNNDDSSQIKCSHYTDSIDFYLKKKIISKLGIERFRKKCAKVKDRLHELAYIRHLNLKEPVITYDRRPDFEAKVFDPASLTDKELWQQLFYELVFEALGYSKNKSIMSKLAQSVNIQFLHKLGKDEESLFRYESALLGVSGLLPDETKYAHGKISPYVQNIFENWEIIRRVYDGELFNNADWHFFKLRPQNFPTIRIAGGVKFLDMLIFEDILSTITKKFTEIRNLNVLINSIRSLFVIKSKGYWKNHYVFDSAAKDEIKYFVGASRADEIVVNVVLPFFSVYFDLFKNEELNKKVLKTYNVYDQRSDNKIVREVAEGLHTSSFLKKTILTQGMLELFRNYCSKRKCLECEIGKLIFN